jgi:hypothetical protein
VHAELVTGSGYKLPTREAVLRSHPILLNIMPYKPHVAVHAELVTGSGYKLPTKMAPMRSHPAVDVARGLEGAIPNG